MCGLCGVVGFGDESLTERMASTLAHRGPDDAGTLAFPEVKASLGFRRLSILDTSSAAHQPFLSDDGKVAVVLNGEIYNFRTLRRELEEKGERFKSSGDSEVVLRLYMREGIGSVKRLNGMFAIGVLDARNARLYLVRDRIGIKPLYYAQSGGRFAFASEIKALLESGIVQADVDRQAMYDYFTFLYVPHPATIFKGIGQLSPGHILELHLATMKSNLSEYWSLADAAAASEGDLREGLTDAVRMQLVSDVPLGVFLSGGIDSAIVTGLMSETSEGRVKTFTVVFEGKGFDYYDERNSARATAKRFSTDHHEIPVRIGDPSGMFSLISFFDQPFGNPTFYLMRLISEAARGSVTVALCGAGGDELFGGYPRYRAMRLARRFGWMPGSAVRGLGLLLKPFRDRHESMRMRRMRSFFGGWDADEVSRFTNWTYFMDEDEKRRLLSNGRLSFPADPSERVIRSELEDGGGSGSSRWLFADLKTFLIDNVLEYTDKMSMSVGLEVRVPFLDHRFVESAMHVPFGLKVKGGRTKAILRDTFDDLLAQEVKRGPKKGFNVPLAAWMRGPLDHYFERTMTERKVTDEGIFDWHSISGLRADHLAGRADNSYELFSIMVFDHWFRTYILGESSPSANVWSRVGG